MQVHIGHQIHQLMSRPTDEQQLPTLYKEKREIDCSQFICKHTYTLTKKMNEIPFCWCCILLTCF